jgi:hypothetical protein
MQRVGGEGRTGETAQHFAGSFCEGAGAICSVGGRFIAWQAPRQEASWSDKAARVEKAPFATRRHAAWLHMLHACIAARQST